VDRTTPKSGQAAKGSCSRSDKHSRMATRPFHSVRLMTNAARSHCVPTANSAPSLNSWACMLRDVLQPRLVADDLLRLCFLEFRQRLRNLIACSVLGATMLCSGDRTCSAAGESADRNFDADELTGSVGR
jgi:hypothetical protein